MKGWKGEKERSTAATNAFTLDPMGGPNGSVGRVVLDRVTNVVKRRAVDGSF